MSVQKSQSISPNNAPLQANNLYRLMMDVRALRDRARSLEERSEAKTPDRNPNGRREGTTEKYRK